MKLKSKIIVCFCFAISFTVITACNRKNNTGDKAEASKIEKESASFVETISERNNTSKALSVEKEMDNSMDKKIFTKDPNIVGGLKGTVKTEGGQQALVLYEEFLFSDEMYSLTATAEHPRGDSNTIYALGDCTGDGLPELHIKGGYLYNIYTYQDGKVALLCSYDQGVDPFEHGMKPLKDGGFVGYKPTGASYDNFYYRKLDAQGNFIESESRDFSIEYAGDGINHTYQIEGVQATKEEFEETFAPYRKLLEDESTKIEWKPVFLEQEWDELNRRNNDFFFSKDVDCSMYTSDFNFLTDLDFVEKVSMSVKELYQYDDGIVYEFKITLQNDLPKEDYTSFGRDRLHLGYFYVMEDQYSNQIYHINDIGLEEIMQLKEEDWKKRGKLVCCTIEIEDSLGEDEKGWHSWITRNENRCEYYSYNNMTETGYYENFIWEEGKGLVEYVSGYGAMKEHINLWLLEE